jgi:hypothetical protein
MGLPLQKQVLFSNGTLKGREKNRVSRKNKK